MVPTEELVSKLATTESGILFSHSPCLTASCQGFKLGDTNSVAPSKSILFGASGWQRCAQNPDLASDCGECNTSKVIDQIRHWQLYAPIKRSTVEIISRSSSVDLRSSIHVVTCVIHRSRLLLWPDHQASPMLPTRLSAAGTLQDPP